MRRCRALGRGICIRCILCPLFQGLSSRRFGNDGGECYIVDEIVVNEGEFNCRLAIAGGELWTKSGACATHSWL